MCGIAGTFCIDQNLLTKDSDLGLALKSLSHRGPDDEGTLRIGSASLGHRRLSVIDTSALGHQPFEDIGGRYSIVFNGEVFNFQELRSDLEKDGHTFSSRTDTEVVLRLFVVKGPAFLHLLNGFFALAIHDAETDTLFLARDRFGVKPLLWTLVDGRFCFGSEARALMELGAEREVDMASLETYLTFHYTPSPKTMLRGVQFLLPGHSITVDSDGVRTAAWYDLLGTAKRTRSVDDADKHLYDLIDDAVRLRLIADVPVGTFLSGGVDSSIVSALAARHHPDLHTFSIGYADDPFFDETAFAEEVATHIGSRHETFKLTREELAEQYPKLLEATDLPFADSSALPSFILCERTRRSVTVALSGDGADEVFGGYRKHQAELRWRAPGVQEQAVRALAPLWRVLPRSRNSVWQDRFRQFDRFARLSNTPAADRFLELASFTDPFLAKELISNPADRGEITQRRKLMAGPLEQLPDMNGALLADVQSTLPNDMLYKVDLTSMAHALEVRTPFLDHRVVEFAFSLPWEAKMRVGSGKHILRTTFGHLLPTAVMSRSKKGFEVPLLELFLGPLSSFIDKTMNSHDVAGAGLDQRAVNTVLQELRSTRPGSSQATVHALLVYLSWWKKHINA